MDTARMTQKRVSVSPEFTTAITPQMIVELRKELGQSQAQFGMTLKRAIDPGAREGYSRQYINGLEKGNPKMRITEEIAGAFWGLAAVLDDVPAGIGGAVHVRLLAQPGQVEDGALVKRSLKTKQCARPGCNVKFVGPGKYHDVECRKAWAREMRKRNK